MFAQTNPGISIGWERSEYTVQEEEGRLEVCARLVGTLAVPIVPYQVNLQNLTAMEDTGQPLV